MFTKAIVRKPSNSMVNGITSANLGSPRYELAVEQHRKYVDALIDCGLRVSELPRDEDYPDSVFIEDTAVITDKFAVITNPGAPSRKGEVIGIKEELLKFYAEVEKIQYPGTLDGGDVMKVRDHFYIGLSSRTNREGADQLVNILQKYGYTGSVVLLKSMLHLKAGVSYLGNNDLLVAGEMICNEEFRDFNRIEVPEKESYSANCICVSDNILFASGFPETKEKINSAGYSIIELNMSEFRKIDGGLSCLSLRF